MRKALLKVVAAVLVIIVSISALGVAVAQEEEDVIQPEVPVLAVQAAEVVQVGEEVVFKVTERTSHMPVAGASVYAVSWPLSAVSDVAEVDWTPAYSCKLIGETDADGNVVHIFDKAGKQLIVANEEGYGPGLARLVVKPVLQDRLVIKAPDRAAVDEPVNLGVFEKNSGNAIYGADVWAIELPGIISIRENPPTIGGIEELIEELRNAEKGDVTDILNTRGEHLGQTDTEGMLEHTFTETGRYMLVAAENEHVPAFKALAIVADKALAVKAEPGRSAIGEDITFTVLTKGTGAAVSGADLYVVEFPLFRSTSMNIKDLITREAALQQFAIDNGVQIGTTNEEGQYVHQFDAAGVYLVVGIKDEYMPGFTFIPVGQFDELRPMLPQIKEFGEGLGQRWTLRQFGPFAGEDGLNIPFPRIQRFREWFNAESGQQGN